jgi:hypothetical protein
MDVEGFEYVIHADKPLEYCGCFSGPGGPEWGRWEGNMSDPSLLALTQDSSHFSADDFTGGGLLAGLATQGKSRIPIGHPDVERAFREIVDHLSQSALRAAKGGHRRFAFQILEVLDDLRDCRMVFGRAFGDSSPGELLFQIRAITFYKLG